MKTLIRLWLEWDYGQEHFVFNSEKDAFSWLETILDVDELDLLGFNSIQEIFDSGLAGYEIVELWETE